MSGGPLDGLRVVEVASQGPGPFCAMLLADMGAEVLRLDRLGAPTHSSEPLLRGRPVIGIDLKQPAGAQFAMEVIERADVLIEGFRPGVMERLGLGPEACLDRNASLIYARVTGWGQDGPMAPMAGHDIDYLALAGALWAVGEAGRPPPPPLNLVADFGGGGMLLAFGITAALVERGRSGKGQVIDAAMVDGVALLTAMLHGHRAAGIWADAREANLLDGGAPFYRTYETADGGYMAVGAIESKFYAEFIGRLGIEVDPAEQYDRASWPATTRRIAARFREQPRAAWTELYAGTDACVVPVLAPGEAPADPHLGSRGTFITVDGVTQPAPAPRFSRAGGSVQRRAAPISVLDLWGAAEQAQVAVSAGVVDLGEVTGEHQA